MAAFLNWDKKALHFASSSNSFQRQEKQTIYPQRGYRWQSQHHPWHLQLWSRWQFRIQRQAPLATIQESIWQAAIQRFLHVNTWKTSRSNSINLYTSATPTSWALGVLYCLGGGGWMPACAAGIQEGIGLSVWMIESACKCIYLLEEGFKQRLLAIGCMESWKSLAIWALWWQCDRPHCRLRILSPDNPFRRSGDGHRTCKAFSYQSYDVCESHCHECGQDRPDP